MAFVSHSIVAQPKNRVRSPSYEFGKWDADKKLNSVFHRCDNEYANINNKMNHTHTHTRFSIFVCVCVPHDVRYIYCYSRHTQNRKKTFDAFRLKSIIFELNYPQYVTFGSTVHIYGTSPKNAALQTERRIEKNQFNEYIYLFNRFLLDVFCQALKSFSICWFVPFFPKTGSELNDFLRNVSISHSSTFNETNEWRNQHRYVKHNHQLKFGSVFFVVAIVCFVRIQHLIDPPNVAMENVCGSVAFFFLLKNICLSNRRRN